MRSSFVFLRRKTKSKTTSALREEAEVVLFCQGKTKQKTTRKPKAEAAFLFCFSALPFRGRGKSKTNPPAASRKNVREKRRPRRGPKTLGKGSQNNPGEASAGHYATTHAHSQRPGRRAAAEKRRPARRVCRNVPPGHGSSLKTQKTRGAGRSGAPGQTFFLLT